MNYGTDTTIFFKHRNAEKLKQLFYVFFCQKYIFSQVLKILFIQTMLLSALAYY